MKNLALYVHIPFCKQKCKYCDFNSYAGRLELENSYVEAIKTEILSYAKLAENYVVTSVYFGGGTPSFISLRNIEDIMRVIRENYSFVTLPEITIEANPGTISQEKIEGYLTCGINRLSFGVQAVQDSILCEIGRVHTFSDVEKGYFMARNAGFNNISFDLMFGLPKQTIEDVAETIKCFIDLAPEHVSAYSLKVEENTLFGKMQREKRLVLPSENEEREMYYFVKNSLKEAGYNQYEISNFAKLGKESRHNLAYWRRTDYFGFGAGAASCFENCRFSNEEDLEKYIELEDKKVYVEKLDSDIIHSEEIILGLRLLEGVPSSLFVGEKERNALEKMIKYGLLMKENNRVSLTERGLDLANQVFVEFI